MQSHTNRQVVRAATVLAVFVVAWGAGISFADGVDDLLRQADAARRAGDVKKALELVDRAVAEAPKDARGYLLRARLHDEARDFEKLVRDWDKLVELEPGESSVYHRRGMANFRAGNVDDAVRDFDKYVEMEPAELPYHWQRGIALYYVGRYEDGRKQFESHQTVNKNDVENAAWHYLCVARAEGVDKARASLIPISGDARVPMKEVHALFAGKVTPEAVLAAARAGNPGAEDLKDRLFYAHLYLGLFYEAAGDTARAREHIDLAAGEFRQTHYMGDVARVHAERLRKGEDKAGDDDGADDDSTDSAAPKTPAPPGNAPSR
jgi:lipoprotein NlpI